MSKIELLLKTFTLIVDAGIIIVCFKWVFRAFTFKTYKGLETDFYANWNNYTEKLKKCNLLKKCKSGQLISLEEIHTRDMITLVQVVREEYPEIKILWLARKKDSLNFQVVSAYRADELQETGNYFIMPVFISKPL